MLLASIGSTGGITGRSTLSQYCYFRGGLRPEEQWGILTPDPQCSRCSHDLRPEGAVDWDACAWQFEDRGSRSQAVKVCRPPRPPCARDDRGGPVHHKTPSITNVGTPGDVATARESPLPTVR
ncbi:hypothetical protein GCM10010532_003650 [Dactylosporangium siamense]|uniref:Uncharacterized protein n=1 Tax=Dactylosporangium siamense TaxID=685454 RepID=A0A919PFZ9_9ACTN|nr:hypothetical protein Dsi01nite_022010 [Dactylosporangium siamense]